MAFVDPELDQSGGCGLVAERVPIQRNTAERHLSKAEFTQRRVAYDGHVAFITQVGLDFSRAVIDVPAGPCDQLPQSVGRGVDADLPDDPVEPTRSASVVSYMATSLRNLCATEWLHTLGGMCNHSVALTEGGSNTFGAASRAPSARAGTVRGDKDPHRRLLCIGPEGSPTSQQSRAAGTAPDADHVSTTAAGPWLCTPTAVLRLLLVQHTRGRTEDCPEQG
jgi:hypothetical protein